MKKTTRITITAREKGNDERLEIHVEGWKDGELVDPETIRTNEIVGIFHKANMQLLGGAFLQGAIQKTSSMISQNYFLLREARDLLEDSLEKVRDANKPRFLFKNPFRKKEE